LSLSLAPFIQREKPHLSPVAAASFIKNAKPDQKLRVGNGVLRTVLNLCATSRRRGLLPVFAGLLVAVSSPLEHAGKRFAAPLSENGLIG
jgi:hypothetical protein